MKAGHWCVFSSCTRYDAELQSWSEGLVQALLKQICQQDNLVPSATSDDSISEQGQAPTSNYSTCVRHWIVFDAPLQGSWLPPLYHVSCL
jgi:hypothetical protein